MSGGLMRRFLWSVSRKLHLLDVEGEERVPQEGPVILVSNQTNALVPSIVQLGLKRQMQVIAWVQSVGRLVKWGLRCLDMLPMDRFGTDGRAREAVLSLLRQGGILGVFPAGPSASTGHVTHPKIGAVPLAIESGAVLCPVTVRRSTHVWAVGEAGGELGKRLFPRPVKLVLTFHAPVRPEPAERSGKGSDPVYQTTLAEEVLKPIRRRVEPFWELEDPVGEATPPSASHIRLYEWLPLILISIGMLFIWWRRVPVEPMLAIAALAYGLAFLYMLLDIAWIPQHQRTQLLRNVIVPLMLLAVLFPALLDVVARLRLAAWQGESGTLLWKWPFSHPLGQWLAEWWTLTYLFPLFYILTSLWTYFRSHRLQFQKLVRGLLLSFYLGLLLLLLMPSLGRAYAIQVSKEQWGPIARWFYTDLAGASWQFLNFPGLFVLITTYLWFFDRRHRLSWRAARYAPWALNFFLAALFWRGLPWNEALVFALVGWLVSEYVGEVTFKARDGRWV